MKTLRFICWAAVALNFIGTTLFCAQQTTDRQPFCLGTNCGTLLLLLISMVVGLCFYSRYKFRAFILAWSTIAKTNSDGIIVAFMTGSGFPVKHSGYLYVASGNDENDADAKRWPYKTRISNNWLRIED
jgi:hypothetical protein